MVISFPSSTTTTATPSSSPATTTTTTRPSHGISNYLLSTLKARFTRFRQVPTLDLSTAPGRAAIVILLCRALYSLAHVVLAVQSRSNTPSEMAVVTLFLVLDLLVVAYCLGRIAGLHGERKVLGFWIGRRQLDAFLSGCAAVHVLYMLYFLIFVDLRAVVFSLGNGPLLTGVKFVIVVVTWVVDRPPTDENGALGIA
ncbi:hypothetical protein N656DRAFT_801057 [Canariomyces notabilis]|uniref:Uncharacterized protein n=1 Tax=Canariomyces notabilis TaxID=2074819 RepID=A0AAN6QLS3_9PEZI|nr:hypothetical protein N656DRAFT_801057 [Canariomyces arenarius]